MNEAQFETVLPSFMDLAEAHFHNLDCIIQKPIFDPQLSEWRYRYLDNLTCAHLKAAKLLSNNRAMYSLIKAGYLQEAAALVRISDDLIHEIHFSIVTEGPALYRFLGAFYAEEFADHEQPLKSGKGRDTIPARKIRSSFANSNLHTMNASTVQEISTTIHRIYSGYIHGAYPQIMELYGGDPPKFHINGSSNPWVRDALRECMASYIYRSLVSLAMISHSIGRADLFQKLKIESETMIKQFNSIIPDAPSIK
jgi:hypothetical protein